MQDRIHQEAGNASARATLMQLAANPYYMQEQKLDSRVGKQQKLRVAANDFLSFRLWQQGRGGKYRAWQGHPSANILCCNGRVIALAMNVEIMTQGLWPRAKTIVSRNSWATQLCWNTVHWFMRTMMNIRLISHLTTSDCGSTKEDVGSTRPMISSAVTKSAVRLINTIQSSEPRPMWTGREKTKRRTSRSKCNSRFENQHESPGKDSDEAAAAKVQCLHITKNHKGLHEGCHNT